MSWSGGRRRLALGKSRLSHLRRGDAGADEDEEIAKGQSGENLLAGMLGGYDEEEDGNQVDKKLLESSDEEDSDSPDEPSPKPPDEENCPWAATIDQSTGKEYYWNKETGKTSWEKPTELIDLDHLKTQYKRMKELVYRRREEKRARREAAKKARDERRAVRAKLRAKMEEERLAKEEEEKKRAEEVKSQFASFMNMIEDLTEEQKKKKTEEDEKKKKEEREAAMEQKKKQEAEIIEGDSSQKKAAEEKRKQILKLVKQKTKWRASTDKTTGKTYFWHKKTQKTTWEKPEELMAAEKEAESELFSDAENVCKKEGKDGEDGERNSRSASDEQDRRRKSREGGRRRTRNTSSSEGGDHSLVLKALATGIRCSVKEAWPHIPEGLEITPLTRARVELDIRMNDWEEGLIGDGETEERLRELASKLRKIVEQHRDPNISVQGDANKDVGIPSSSYRKYFLKQTNRSAESLGPRIASVKKRASSSTSSVNICPKKQNPKQEITCKVPATVNQSTEDRDSDDMEWEVTHNTLFEEQEEFEESGRKNKATGAKRKRKVSKPLKMKNKKMEGLVSKWTKVQREAQREG